MAAVQYDGLEMPPKEKLPAQDIKNLKVWIESGGLPKTEIPLSQQAAVSPASNGSLVVSRIKTTSCTNHPVRLRRMTSTNSF